MSSVSPRLSCLHRPSEDVPISAAFRGSNQPPEVHLDIGNGQSRRGRRRACPATLLTPVPKRLPREDGSKGESIRSSYNGPAQADLVRPCVAGRDRLVRGAPVWGDPGREKAQPQKRPTSASTASPTDRPPRSRCSRAWRETRSMSVQGLLTASLSVTDSVPSCSPCILRRVPVEDGTEAAQQQLCTGGGRSKSPTEEEVVRHFEAVVEKAIRP